MAGAGVKLFVQNTPLTAADLNTYIQDQVICVFDNEAARTAAFGGAGEPSLSEGRFSYLKDTDKLYYYPQGGPWAEVNAQVEDGEIITAKIADGAITQAKLATGTPQAGFRSVQNAATITSSNYTIQLSDLGKLVEIDNATACTLTVPTNASVAFSVGDRIDILQIGAGQVTVTPVSGTVTINGYDGGLKLNGQWASATLVKRATNTWVAIGNLTT